MRKFKEIFKRNKNDINQVVYKDSTSKYSMTSACTMEISSKTIEKQKEIETQLKELIKKYIKTPEELLNYIRLEGANVYKINNAAKILSFIDEEEGFIAPLSGIKAFILNLFLLLNTKKKIKLSFSTSEMLIFEKKNCDIYIIAKALHKYYGAKNNLPGFDKKSQDVFRKLYGGNNKKNRQTKLNKASLDEVLACKTALTRDLEATNFTLQLSTEYERSQKVLSKIKTDETIKI